MSEITKKLLETPSKPLGAPALLVLEDGAVFSGTWTPGDGLTGFGGQFSKIWKDNYTDNVTGESTGAQKFGYGALGVVNSILNVAGNLAAIYNLGFGTAKNIVGEGVYKA